MITNVYVIQYVWVARCLKVLGLYAALDCLVQKPEYSRTQGCQVLLNFSILLLKLHFCYGNFHEILAKILKFVLISQLFPHKNTEICIKLCILKLLQFVTEVSLWKVGFPVEELYTHGWPSTQPNQIAHHRVAHNPAAW